MSTQDLDTAWTPTLGSEVLYTEHTWFSGVFAQAIGYGIIIPLAVQCEIFLYRSISRSNRRNKIAWMALVFILFVCATVCAVADERLAELSFIYYRNYPGGPSAFELNFNSLPVNAIGNVFLVIADWICTGIQLWRAYILYSSSVVPIWFIMSIPCLAYAATIVLGILWSIQVNQPTSNSFITTSINWTAPYLGLTLALNIVVSVSLVLRLIEYRLRLSRVGIGTSTYSGGGVNYLGIAAMITESAVIYSTFSLLSLVFFLTNHPIQNVFDPLFIMTEIIATLLILYRVASGSAWSSDTASQLFSTQITVGEGTRLELKGMKNVDTSHTKISTFGDSITLASTHTEAIAV